MQAVLHDGHGQEWDVRQKEKKHKRQKKKAKAALRAAFYSGRVAWLHSTVEE